MYTGQYVRVFKNISVVLNTDLSHLSLGEGGKKCLQFGHYFRPPLEAVSFI